MRHPVVTIETPRLVSGINEIAEFLRQVADTTFEEEVLKSNRPVLVFFWVPDCPYCMLFSPIFEEVALETRNVKFAKVNAAKERKTSSKYRIQAVPTLMVFRYGEPDKQIIGFKTEAELREILADIEKYDSSSSYSI